MKVSLALLAPAAPGPWTVLTMPPVRGYFPSLRNDDGCGGAPQLAGARGSTHAARRRSPRRAHRLRQHDREPHDRAARGDRQVRHPDGQARVRRLDHAAALRLEGGAAAPRDPADAAVRLHARQELHRLGADHRRDGPPLRGQRGGLRHRLERQRLHAPGDAAAGGGDDRLRARAAQHPDRVRRGVRPLHLPRPPEGGEQQARRGAGAGAAQPQEAPVDGDQQHVQGRRLVQPR